MRLYRSVVRLAQNFRAPPGASFTVLISPQLQLEHLTSRAGTTWQSIFRHTFHSDHFKFYLRTTASSFHVAHYLGYFGDAGLESWRNKSSVSLSTTSGRFYCFLFNSRVAHPPVEHECTKALAASRFEFRTLVQTPPATQTTGIDNVWSNQRGRRSFGPYPLS